MSNDEEITRGLTSSLAISTSAVEPILEVSIAQVIIYIYASGEPTASDTELSYQSIVVEEI